MRPRMLLTMFLTAIAIPVVYHAWTTFVPTKAPVPEVLEMPEPELQMIHIKRSAPPLRNDVPGREFVPPLPVAGSNERLLA